MWLKKIFFINFLYSLAQIALIRKKFVCVYNKKNCVLDLEHMCNKKKMNSNNKRISNIIYYEFYCCYTLS